MSRLRSLWNARHDPQQVDLAFVVDCTGSMGSYIRETQRNITNIAETISRTAFNVRLALVEYRDHPPQDDTYVSRFHDFTYSVTEMKEWVSNMSAAGGGDIPEAVADGLHDALNLNYREGATKICVWIGDAPPHGLSRSGDEFAQGCPSNRDPVAICHEMAARGIILYCVGCEPSLSQHRDFFMALSLITGGQYIRLQRAKLLSQIIVLLTQEEVENENLMGYVQDHIELELAGNVSLSVDELTDSLHNVLHLNNNRTRRMRYNNREIEPFTNLARRISFLRTLTEAAAAIREANQNEIAQPQGRDENELELITSVDVTDLDEVTPRQCERLVRRSLARNRQQARNNRQQARREPNDEPME